MLLREGGRGGGELGIADGPTTVLLRLLLVVAAVSRSFRFGS
jgi:hypothetical protein